MPSGPLAFVLVILTRDLNPLRWWQQQRTEATPDPMPWSLGGYIADHGELYLQLHHQPFNQSQSDVPLIDDFCFLMFDATER